MSLAPSSWVRSILLMIPYSLWKLVVMFWTEGLETVGLISSKKFDSRPWYELSTSSYQRVVCSKIIGESIHIRLHTLGFQAKMCTYSVTIMQKEEYQFGWQQSLPMSLELLPPSSRSTKFSFSMMTANNATRRLRSAPFCAPPQTHCQNIGKNRSQKVTRKTLVSVVKVGFIIGFAAGSKCYWKK